jgi:hypothetical protein
MPQLRGNETIIGLNKRYENNTQFSSVCFMQFIQVSLLGTSHKRSYRKNDILF